MTPTIVEFPHQSQFRGRRLYGFRVVQISGAGRMTVTLSMN